MHAASLPELCLGNRTGGISGRCQRTRISRPLPTRRFAAAVYAGTFRGWGDLGVSTDARRHQAGDLRMIDFRNIIIASVIGLSAAGAVWLRLDPTFASPVPAQVVARDFRI